MTIPEVPIRAVPLLCALLVAMPAWAEDEAPAPKAEQVREPALAPRAIALSHAATTIARGRAGAEVLIATEDGTIVRHEVGGSTTWRGTTGGAAADALAAAPAGDCVAAATATEVLVFGAEEGEALWRAKRPVAFAFDAAGRRLVTLTRNGEVVELDAATGAEVARRQVAEERDVVKASLHTEAGLAVLGVADG